MSKSKNIDTNTKLTREDMLTADVAAEKLHQLRELFPGAFGEGVNDEGETVTQVDCQRILAEIGLGTDAFFTRRERYGLDWPGKTECVKLIQQPSLATLMPCPEESVDFDTTENLFLEGDNLEVLKLLQKSYFGKVKMIYIDPPYNTGHDFVYPDDFAEPLDNYLELTGQKDALGRKLSANAETAGRFHTNWLNMMFPRLYLARNLLREDGVIFISIDDNEVTNLKHLCNEVFGEENFVANILWQKKYAVSNDDPGIAPMHDHILVYRKGSLYKRNLLPRQEKQLSRYNNPDNDPRGDWSSGEYVSSKSRWERPTLWYSISHPKTNKKVWPDENAVWRYSEEKHEIMVAENRLYWGPDMSYEKPRLKRFLSEIQEGVVPSTWWPFEDVGHNDEASKEVGVLIGKKVFSTPKPVRLLKKMLLLSSSSSSSDDLILDFFSGSATTAHAVLEMNKEDGGNRRFILVQLPEPCDENSEAFKAGYKTIAEIGKERIRRVIKKIKEEQTENGKSLLDGDEKPQDLGFRVFKLDRSNFRVWDGSPGTTAEQLFERMAAMINPLRDGTKPENLLYELLLKAGFPLSTQVRKIKLAGKTVYSVEDDAVLLCLENEITKELIDEIIKLDPVRFYCLDKAFKKNDQLKVNTIQQFAAHNQGRDKETEIVFRTI